MVAVSDSDSLAPTDARPDTALSHAEAALVDGTDATPSGAPRPPTMPADVESSTGIPGVEGLPDLPGAPQAAEPVEDTGRRDAAGHPLPRIIAVANQKGGVGKTTTAVNLGAALADVGYRTLIVDLDPQGNASTGLGINIRDLQLSMYDVIIHEASIDDTIEATAMRNLFVAPSSLDLAGAEIELVPAFSRELRLRHALEEVRDDFDYVLIDCPPSLGLLTVNGLAAAGEVLVPIQCEYYALEGLGQLLRNVLLVQRNLNKACLHLRVRDVRRPDQAGRSGRERGPRALRRTRVPHRGAAHRATVRGTELRAAHLGLRPPISGRDRLPGTGTRGERRGS